MKKFRTVSQVLFQVGQPLVIILGQLFSVNRAKGWKKGKKISSMVTNSLRIIDNVQPRTTVKRTK